MPAVPEVFHEFVSGRCAGGWGAAGSETGSEALLSSVVSPFPQGDLLCCDVVPTEADDTGGQLGEASLPGGEAVTEYAQVVPRTSKGVTALDGGLVRVVVDSVYQPGWRRSGLPPAV